MQVRSSHHLTAILQAGNCNQTTWQYTNWDNATHVPMWCNPNISTYLFNTTGLHEGWEKNMQLEYGNECRFAPSHNFISKQAISTKQPASMQIVSSCDNATHVVQPKHTHYIVCPIPLGCKRLEDNHAGGMRVIMWFIPFHCYTSSRQIQRNNLPLFKLWQCNPCGVTQTSTRICSIALVCTKVGRNSCS